MRYLCICGCYRSGTTAIVNILNKVDNVLVCDELWYFKNDIAFSINSREKFYYALQNHNELIGRRCVSKSVLKDNYEKFYRYFLNKDSYTREEIRDKLIELTKGEVDIFGDKLPEYTLDLKTIKGRWNPKIIMCLRDGRDVITAQILRYRYYMERHNSIGNHWWTKPSIEECLNMSHNWLYYIKAWYMTKPKLDDYFELKYWKVDRQIKELADFLEVNYKQVKEAFDKEWKPKIGTWKEYLPDINEKLPKEWKEMIEKISRD